MPDLRLGSNSGNMCPKAVLAQPLRVRCIRPELSSSPTRPLAARLLSWSAANESGGNLDALTLNHGREAESGIEKIETIRGTGDGNGGR